MLFLIIRFHKKEGEKEIDEKGKEITEGKKN